MDINSSTSPFRLVARQVGPDTRVQDWLDDKLQTEADIDNVNVLLETVRQQQDLLRAQLEEAVRGLNTYRESSEDDSLKLRYKAEEYQRQQNDIDQRLLVITRSTTSDDAAVVFSKSVEKLQRLDVATAYIKMLHEVDRLSTLTREKIRISPGAALEPYTQLKTLSITLKQLQHAAEDAAPHLVDHVEKAARIMWKEMVDTLSMELEVTLKALDWPRPDATVEGPLMADWESCVINLLDLQRPDFEEQEKRADLKEIVLLPLEVMVKPLELRFRYHFDSDRPTNRLDKPEYFLSHITEILRSYEPFVKRHLQPLLTTYFVSLQSIRRPACVDASNALIISLLPMLRRKIYSYLPHVQRTPHLFSHFMHELMSFDTSIRDEWHHVSGNHEVIQTWKGLTGEVLAEKDWFAQWLQVEQDFALSRYDKIIQDVTAREIDYDSLDPGVTKPTKAAIRVNDLLETITDRYRTLVDLSPKFRFLIDIQIAIFDRFHRRLTDAVEAYQAANSTVIRAVQGVSKEEKERADGISGLETLCRVYGSADYLEKAMEDWNDDVFFVELWDELQRRARRTHGWTLAGTLSVQAVSERISNAVGSSDENTGGLFDETASAYDRLRERTEILIVELLARDMKETLRPYTKTGHWASLDADPNNFAITAEIDGAVQQVDQFLAFLSGVLATAPLRRISRKMNMAIEQYLWDYILLRNRFSHGGADQFQRDLNALWRAIDKHLGDQQGAKGMKKLREGTILLNLPLKRENESDSFPGLEEIESRIFESNSKAREALEQLGLIVLSETDARRILQARVELGS